MCLYSGDDLWDLLCLHYKDLHYKVIGPHYNEKTLFTGV